MPSVGVPSWQSGMPAHALCWALSQRASRACILLEPLPWAAMPRAFQLWLPQPHLRVQGQASGSLSGEKRSVCGWQCFPNCGCDRNNNDTTRMAATTPTMASRKTTPHPMCSIRPSPHLQSRPQMVKRRLQLENMQDQNSRGGSVLGQCWSSDARHDVHSCHQQVVCHAGASTFF